MQYRSCVKQRNRVLVHQKARSETSDEQEPDSETKVLFLHLHLEISIRSKIGNFLGIALLSSEGGGVNESFKLSFLSTVLQMGIFESRNQRQMFQCKR